MFIYAAAVAVFGRLDFAENFRIGMDTNHDQELSVTICFMISGRTDLRKSVSRAKVDERQTRRTTN